MQPAYILGLLMAVFCVTGLCHPNPVEAQAGDQIQEEQQINSDFSTLQNSSYGFAFDLFKSLVSKNPKENVLFSPLSISTAFALLSLGARETTQTQILEGLRFNLTETPEAEIHRGFQQLIRSLNRPNKVFQLTTGNALFIDKSSELLEKFREDTKLLYSSEILPANFKNSNLATEQINDYVKKQTKGKITDFFDRLEEDTIMVLVNYVFFKAKWQEPFDPYVTRPDKFFVSEDKVVEVPMMLLNEFYPRVFLDKELLCTVVELKYRGNATALFILPDRNKMKDVEDALNPEVLKKWKNSLREREVNLFLPKFSISNDYSLEEILPTMGIEEVFTDQANLSGITGQNNLKVSKAVHKAVLDVDEAGTEAAAATGMKIVPSSARWPAPLEIKFNTPFLVFVFDGNNMLFMGKVNNPLNA
ncbi:alpha-1-antichymotrypsin-like [Phascolarctos cinereus]|uniref:Alpha-1-antichymotrypsin-like n=1 Tax=Phascolarctos cinereus TaxID=38626 RepID=A0A6P5LQZ2_PHACI|nr:alpha-1-antichymotrypsin-like [Phascolarctos cinereus]